MPAATRPQYRIRRPTALAPEPDYTPVHTGVLSLLGTRPLLALDIASYVTGWALVWPGHDNWFKMGHFRLSGDTLSERASDLYEQTAEMFANPGEHGSPVIIVAESPDLMSQGMTTTPATLKAMYACSGAVMALAGTLAVPYVEVDARYVKAQTTGRANADKADVQVYLSRRGFKLKEWGARSVDHDAADALALGVVIGDALALLKRAYASRS